MTRDRLRYAPAGLEMPAPDGAKAYSDQRQREKLSREAMKRAIARQVELYGGLIPPQGKLEGESQEAEDARIRRGVADGSIPVVPVPEEYR